MRASDCDAVHVVLVPQPVQPLKRWHFMSERAGELPAGPLAHERACE